MTRISVVSEAPASAASQAPASRREGASRVPADGRVGRLVSASSPGE